MSKDPKIEEMMEFATHMMKSATERIGKTPFARQLGIRLLDHEKGRVRLIAPYDKKLVGSLEDGFVHGGVVTTLLDNASGLSIATALDEPKSMATLDLRIDYMRAATPGDALTARAACYHVTRSVAFVRATAHDARTDVPVASATGAFTVDGSKKVTP